MGTIYRAECSCGYSSAALFEGCGMLGADSCRDLATCAHCGIMVTTPSESKRPRCPECRRKLERILLDEDMDKEKLDCPHCGEKALRLVFEGMWD